MHEFLYIMIVMFPKHDMLGQQADYLGARAVNCVPDSMIDSYERKNDNK